MPTATKPKPTDLRTVNLTGVEILRAGTWNGDPYGPAELAAIVEAFEAGNAGIEPPIKLGHPPDQKLLNNSGLPAAGYVSALRLDGEVLVADFRDVPERIAALIRAKAYSKVSSEIYFDFSDGETTHPRLLKAVALLGADVPAVTSLADVEAWYGRAYAALSDQPAGDVRVYELPAGMSYNDLFDAARTAARSRYGDHAWVCDLFDDAAIVEIGGACYRISFTTDGQGAVSFAPDMLPVKRVTVWRDASAPSGGTAATADTELHAAEYRAAEADEEDAAKRKKKKGALPASVGGGSPETNPASAGPRKPSPASAVGNLADSDEEDLVATLAALMERMEARHKGGKGMPALRAFAREMSAKLSSLRAKPARVAAHTREDTMNPETLRLLGLAEDADEAAITAAITALKGTAEAKELSQNEVRQLSDQVGKLTATLAQRDAHDAVEAAIAGGKVLPAQKDWARSYALRDPDGFKAYTDATPAFPLGGSGATGAASDPSRGTVRELTAAEREIALAMGNDPEKVAEFKEKRAAGAR